MENIFAGKRLGTLHKKISVVFQTSNIRFSVHYSKNLKSFSVLLLAWFIFVKTSINSKEIYSYQSWIFWGSQWNENAPLLQLGQTFSPFLLLFFPEVSRPSRKPLFRMLILFLPFCFDSIFANFETSNQSFFGKHIIIRIHDTWWDKLFCYNSRWVIEPQKVSSS